MFKKVAFVICVIATSYFGYQFYFSGSRELPEDSFTTTQITKGSLRVTVNSTGTVEPEEVVDIGAQVAGKIEAFGLDAKGQTIDYGSEVGEGTVLAKIDDSLYMADMLQADAALKRAHASSQQAQAKYMQSEHDWTRAQKLGSSEVLAKSSYDASEASYLLAKADISIAEAEVAQAEAALTKAKRNLENCTIKSPVHGVIIDRRVNIGQTVVSSLNAPSLFLIAKDLKQMEVWVSVNEADIASITPNQDVVFSVDAIPGVEFVGTVEKVRLNASMTQNVVTFLVEVLTDNSNNKLLPYLTANVKFLVKKFDDVLLVPSSALRWSPSPELLDSWSSDADNSNSRDSNSRGDKTASDMAQIWVYDGAKGREFKVRLIGSDGINAAIEGKDVAEGMKVITGDTLAKASKSRSGDSSPSSPFTPSLGRGKH